MRFRVGDEWRGYEEGRALVFDDSFEHEVVHGGEVRVDDCGAPFAGTRYIEPPVLERSGSEWRPPFMLPRGDRKPLTSVCPFGRVPPPLVEPPLPEPMII